MSSASSSSRRELRLVDSTEPSDSLVERAVQGDHAAWKELYLDHFHDVLRLVAYATADVGVAEELTQEAFAIALVRLDRFDGRCAFGGWMRGIAMKLVHKHWRKNRRRARAHHRLSAAPPVPARTPDDQMQVHRRARDLEAALTELPPHLREAFVLADVHGMSAAQAAEEFGISPGNFRVRASRARARLREVLIRMGSIDQEQPA